jgi:hypothetical protein
LDGNLVQVELRQKYVLNRMANGVAGVLLTCGSAPEAPRAAVTPALESTIGGIRVFSSRSRTVRRIAGLVVFCGLLAATPALASLCVWRSPDADIASIYGSGSYKTIFEDIDGVRRVRIEKTLGFALDADETQFKFFPVFKGGKPVGTVMTHASKGQFGAIEVVVAVVDTGAGATVKLVRIQRDREKAKAALRGAEFLNQFRGMDSHGDFTFGPDGLKPARPDAVKSSQSVALAVRKLLVIYDDFYGPGAK